MKKKLIRFDWAIKKILRNKANFDVLEGFLSELLKENIKIVRILESEGNQENKEDKFNRVDILIENSEKELVIVEVQNDTELDYFQRILYGTSKLLTEYMDLGDEYAQLKKVISVSIVYFDLGKGQDYVYHGKTSFYGLHQKDQLELNPKQQNYLKKETVESIFPEYYVIKPHSFEDNVQGTLDEWVYFFKHSQAPTNISAKGLQKAKQVLDIMKLDQKAQKQYQKYLEDLSYEKSITATMKFEAKFEAERIKKMILEQGRQQGLREGRKEGREEGLKEGEEKGKKEGKEEGRKEEKIEIAENLLQNNVPLDIIATSTGLTVEEIEKLKTKK